jgi:hypothetical protein
MYLFHELADLAHQLLTLERGADTFTNCLKQLCHLIANPF